jgi:hypothetical protein
MRRNKMMNLAGIEVSSKASFALAPNTILVVVSDEHGAIRWVEIDKNLIVENEVFLKVLPPNLQPPIQLKIAADVLQQQRSLSVEKAKVTCGCYKRLGDKVVWKDPCN